MLMDTTQIFFPVILLHAPCYQTTVQVSLCIHQEREIEFLFRNELFMGFLGIFGNTKDNIIIVVQTTMLSRKSQACFVQPGVESRG